jgi:probable FeS assembly SUF system protein SufT
MTNRERVLSREVVATQIPSGDRQTLPSGTRVLIHQTLGGNFTVQTDFGLFRIDGAEGDAMGEQKPASPVASPAEAPVQGAKEGPKEAPSPEAIWSQLRQVYDPEIPVNIVDLGLVYSMDIEPIPDGAGHKVDVAMTLTAPGCGMGPAIAEDARTKILHVPGIAAADVRITWDPPWNQSMISEEGKMKLGLI